jgi:hypothetical protein
MIRSARSFVVVWNSRMLISPASPSARSQPGGGSLLSGSSRWPTEREAKRQRWLNSCNWCGKQKSDKRRLFSDDDNYNRICEPCARKIVATFDDMRV